MKVRYWRSLRGLGSMKRIKRLLTLDANVFVAALKRDELYSDKCAEILGKIPRKFVEFWLEEPAWM